ncbi:MAG: hypothetical protein WC792_04465 [Candidatus Micrarchaeia archaeon]
MEGPEAYYEAACRVLSESNCFFVLARTPTLLLPQEKQSPWRHKYFRMACKRIKEGMPTTYIFSEPETVAKLGEINPKILKRTLGEWRKFAALKNFDLRRVDGGKFHSMVFGDKLLAVAQKDRKTGKSIAATIKPIQTCAKQLKEFFAAKKRSKTVCCRYLDGLEKKLLKNRR